MEPSYYKETFDAKCGIFPAGLSGQQKYDLKMRAKNYLIKDGELWYINTRKRDKTICETKVVRTAEEANAIFIDFHASPHGAHCGQTKTIYAIGLRYYWPGMSDDIKKWVAECPECQRKRTIKAHKEYIPITVSEPFELVGIDLVGPLNTTDNGNKYLCVMVEYFTKWSEAYPIKSKRATEVVDCIMDFFYKFGAPKRILSDQGREFVNDLNRDICARLGIERSLCAPYHPQTNGLTERMNGTITRTLIKLSNQKPNDWDKYVQAAMFGLRTKVQLTTKYSPYFLLFGREARYPSEVPTNYEINDDYIEELTAQEVLSEGLKRQEDIYEIVSRNAVKAQAKTRKRKLEKGGQEGLVVGDEVLRENLRAKQRKGDKLAEDRAGPLTIIKLEGKSADLKSEGKIIPSINIDHLVKYSEPQKRIPLKLKISSCHSPSPSTSTIPTTEALPSPLTTMSVTQSTADPSTHHSPETTITASPSPSRSSSPSLKTCPSTPALHIASAHPYCASLVMATPDHFYVDTIIKLAPAQLSPMSAGSPGLSRLASPSTPEVLDLSKPRVPESSSKGCDLIDDIWADRKGDMLWCKVGPYKLYTQTMVSLAPGNELESEVLNAYICHVIKRNEQKRIFHVDSFEMTAIWNGKAKGLKKLDLEEYELLLGAVNRNKHWTLVAIYPRQRRSLFLDPFGASSVEIERCKNATRSFVRKKGLNPSRWGCETLPHPLQRDLTSCGAFVCKFAECIIEGRPIEFETSEVSLRKGIAATLLNNTDDLTELCRVCGHIDTPSAPDIGNEDDWIECTKDLCGQWYHQRCIGRPPVDDIFTCPLCT